ncbi:MAG TPA: Sir2 family NAD-dependent protein deacetylase [Candidatus Dormibacteraeota bacterium]
MSASASRSLADVAAWIRDARHVMALTGAGISTESGIPDFRGPQGVWTRNPAAERLSTLSHYMGDRAVRVESWRQRLDHPAWTAKPNAGHLALAELERRGRLHALVTQNIDGLHLDAGNSARTVIEIHGTMRDVVCMACGERAPMGRALDRVRAGEEDPPCRSCGGILKSATISFGQGLVAEDLERAQVEAARCQVFLAVGTSLGVYPAASLPAVALNSGARLVVINGEPTPFDEQADAVFQAPIGKVLPHLVALLDPHP